MLKVKNKIKNKKPITLCCPKYNTNPNLRLLTQKLQEEVEGLDQNVPVFPENTQKNTSPHVWKERHKQNEAQI